ncbi:hypothetical protein V1971_34485, partial [Pseudomonas aeruginosa]
MSYLVYCTFDLKNASSRDYEKAYEDLNAIGLAKVVKADAGQNVGRRQKLSATPDLSGTVLPLCHIPNS